jgi:hypothetical protein
MDATPKPNEKSAKYATAATVIRLHDATVHGAPIDAAIRPKRKTNIDPRP